MFDTNYQSQSEEISQWIKTILSRQSFSKLIVALSGGIDSSLALTLAVKALGKENVYALIMPNGKKSKEATEDALLMTQFSNLPIENISLIDIAATVKVFEKNTSPLDNIRLGNMLARVRMIYLYDQAKKHNALVCGTENKSEYYLGYFTRFGDEASDIEPIRSLYKTQVFSLANYLGLPQKIVNKAPTAGLWQDQTDEDELGFTYKDADKILYYTIDQKLSPSEIREKGIPQKTIDKVLKRVKSNTFKRIAPFHTS